MERITLPRRITQFLFFALTGQWLVIGWLRCPFGIPFVSCMNCPLTECRGTWLQAWFLGLLSIVSLTLGRAFCGWVCPMGLVEDALGKLPKLRLERTRWFPKVDPWLKQLKWVSLAVVVYLVFALNYPEGRPHPYVVRATTVFNLESVRLATDLGAGFYAVRIVVLLVALVLGVVILRGWCRYLCPLGALLGLFNKVAFWHPKRHESACTHCQRYPRECLQHTEVGTTDCIVCGDCTQGCPAHAIHFRRAPSSGPPPGPAPDAAAHPEESA